MLKGIAVKVTVYRFNPETDQEARYETYELPITKEDRYTVMDILEYIYFNCDTSLSFFNHSACNHGICGRCGLKINGKAGLACTVLVESDELTLEPINSHVVKDLVVRRGANRV